jgi:hypothetical protein
MSSQIFHSGLEMFFNSNPPEESSEVKELKLEVQQPKQQLRLVPNVLQVQITEI